MLTGEFRLVDASAIWRKLHVGSRGARSRLDLDLSHATFIDGAVMALLVDLRASLIRSGVESELVGVSEQLCSVVHLYRGDEQPAPATPRVRPHPIRRLGAAVAHLGSELSGDLIFGGEILHSFGHPRRRPSEINWRSIPGHVVRAGADGMAIVLLLNFLIGFVMAFQSMHQLRLYGANIYVADIVGLAVTRELAPLITAVIIAGRSGASFAAELGAMRVSEEVDALRTMGFSPVGYLVVPRVIALALVAPVLTLLGDVVGVLGGIVVGEVSLGISVRGFISELRTIIVPSDVWTGLVKSFAFGIAIAFIGCRHGLSTRGSASAVGRGTTETVVNCLFSIIVIDTIFTVLFKGFNL